MTIQEFEGRLLKVFAWGGLAYTIPLWLIRYLFKINFYDIGSLALSFIIFQVVCWIVGKCVQVQGKINAERKLISEVKMLGKKNEGDYYANNSHSS